MTDVEGERYVPRGPGPFSSWVDEVLFAMGQEGWANESAGELEAPTGLFYRISNGAVELTEITEAFEDELAAQPIDDPEALLGHFLVKHDGHVVRVEEFPSEETLIDAYTLLRAVYETWAVRGGHGE